MNIKDDTYTSTFHDLITALGLQQLVSCKTHTSGNTLDLILVRDQDTMVVTKPKEGFYISDHSFVLCNLSQNKPGRTVKEIEYRKLKAIDHENLDSLFSSFVQSCVARTDIDELAEFYNESMSRILDEVAPLVKKKVAERECVPWYDASLKSLKTRCRKAEAKWVKTRTDQDHQVYKTLRSEYNQKLNKGRTDCITSKILECECDQNKLYNLINKFTGRVKANPLPKGTDQELSEEFASFFLEKVLNIRSKLQPYPEFDSSSYICSSSFAQFSHMEEDETRKIITGAKMTTCLADPIPSQLLRHHLDTLLPAFCKMINLSLQSGRFPLVWKKAYVRPLIKKPSLAPIFASYRPVSNLSLVSKLTEKAMVKQLTQYMDTNSLLPSYQSAYRRFHSTETAIVKLVNDILLCLDKTHSTLLVAVDLSAAFDTVHHGILLDVMKNKFGVSGTCLNWMSSYLYPRNCVVSVNKALSSPIDLPFSVPQGSVAGPIAFTCYASTLADVVLPTDQQNDHHINIAGYADDHSLYTEFRSGNSMQEQRAVTNMQHILLRLKEWMVANKLQMNDAKTEVIFFKSPFFNQKINTQSVCVGADHVDPTDCIKLLGVWLDTNMTLKKHIEEKCKTASRNLNMLRQIRKFLTVEACKSVVQGLVISHLDYCNAVFIGLPASTLLPLQSIQNQAAKLVLSKKKYDSATSCLQTLHWLPIEQRVKFKVLCLVYKSLHQEAPAYLQDLFKYRTSVYTTRSVSAGDLDPPRTYTKTFGRSRAFSCIGVKLWNELPMAIKTVPNIINFKKSLKTELFKQAFS